MEALLVEVVVHEILACKPQLPSQLVAVRAYLHLLGSIVLENARMVVQLAVWQAHRRSRLVAA